VNTSIIITRYARALVKFVTETGGGDRVCAEAQTLRRALSAVPDLQRMMDAPDVVSASGKKALLQAALDAPMSTEMDRFLDLLLRNGRITLLDGILRDFTDLYRRSIGIRKARLTCVEEPSEDLLDRLRALVKEKTGDDVIIDVKVDPSLIGGFVFDIDDYMLDASVSHQLDRIRQQFIERNRRIV